MASERQIRANRDNAKKSTGPRSTEAKRRVALNAVKHGLFTRSLLLPGESESELIDLEKRLYAQYQPEGDVEECVM